jgi:hypothetical protein
VNLLDQGVDQYLRTGQRQERHFIESHSSYELIGHVNAQTLIVGCGHLELDRNENLIRRSAKETGTKLALSPVAFAQDELKLSVRNSERPSKVPSIPKHLQMNHLRDSKKGCVTLFVSNY